jgi:hypothetical protein
LSNGRKIRGGLDSMMVVFMCQTTLPRKWPPATLMSMSRYGIKFAVLAEQHQGVEMKAVMAWHATLAAFATVAAKQE